MTDPVKRPFQPTDTVEMRTPIEFDENMKLEAIELTVQSGFVSGDTPRVPGGGSKTIGRTGEADFQVPLDEKISRVHCRIECGERNGVVHDLDSRNGTFVNGQRVEGECQIQHGDQIMAGTTVLAVRFVTS